MQARQSKWPNWTDYLQGTISAQVGDECRQRCGPALADQRSLIGQLVEKLQPKKIACLGSGYLNDIPVESMLGGDRVVYLVDWVPDVSVEGLRASIINNEDDVCSCLFCDWDDAKQYCDAFVLPISECGNTCSEFHRQDGYCTRCTAFVPGPEPRFVSHDVTQGRATQFAERAGQIIPNCRSPELAFRRCLDACKVCCEADDRIPIADGELDLVTSSMLVSQFDHEPYGFFATLLETKFGRDDLLKKESSLRPQMENLCTELFQIQMEGHAREMHRMLDKKRGKAYFSVELFRSVPFNEEYFLVQEIPRAMEILGRYFFFDFRAIAPSQTFRAASLGSGTSIIECYVLTPREDVG